VGGRFTVFNALCNLFRRCILNSFYGSSPQTWLEQKKPGERIPSFSPFVSASHHPQNPPLNGSDLSLFLRQRRIEEAGINCQNDDLLTFQQRSLCRRASRLQKLDASYLPVAASERVISRFWNPVSMAF
jgi:hypothetical protein